MYCLAAPKFVDNDIYTLTVFISGNQMGCYRFTTSDYQQWSSILLRYDLKNSGRNPAVSAFRTLPRLLECLPVFELKPAVHAVIRIRYYSFVLMFNRFFYESQVMIDIFLLDTNRLRNIPDCLGVVFK